MKHHGIGSFLFLGLVLGGANAQVVWNIQASGTTRELKAIHCPTALTCYAVGAGGTILKTSNGGNSWAAESSGTLLTLNAVRCVNPTVCNAVGDSGRLLQTSNGSTWMPPGIPGTSDLSDLYFVDSVNGYAVGGHCTEAYCIQNTILKTINDRTWTASQTIWTNPLRRIQFLNHTTGYAIVDSTPYGTGNGIIKTTDGGASWTRDYIPANRLNSIDMLSTNVGFAAGDSGIFMDTLLQGVPTWTRRDSAFSGINSIHFPITALGYAVGKNGLILRTSDMGEDWVPETATSEDLNAVYSPDENTTYAVGANGTILKRSGGPLSLHAAASQNRESALLSWHGIYRLDGKFLDAQGRELAPQSLPAGALLKLGEDGR